MKRLVRNAVKCLKCQETIESTSNYHFVSCMCKSVSIDGGLNYSRIIGNREDFEDLRKWINTNDKKILPNTPGKEPLLLLHTLKKPHTED